MNRTLSSLWIVGGVCLLLLSSAPICLAQDEGIKQVQQLVKKADATVKSVTDAKLQLQKTMEAYNAVLAPATTDRADAYKKLQKEMKNSDKKRADVSKRADEMNLEADKLFKGWEASTSGLSRLSAHCTIGAVLVTANDRVGASVRTSASYP